MIKGKKTVTELVRETIKLFGETRVMFGSNYPVDIASGITPDILVAEFAAMVKDQSYDTKKKLFYDNANRIYRF